MNKNLINRYIKYDKRITFDIFKLMYQKLIDEGFTTFHSLENAFNQFSGRWNELTIGTKYTRNDEFTQYNHHESDATELQVSELLGYDPFSEFKLPEKWCIEVGENAEIINKWKQTTEYTETASNYKYVTCKGTGYKYKSDYTDHSEITIEQFKHYILKEPIITETIEKWSVGSYIVPLHDKLLTRDEPLIKGKPYQIIRRSTVPYIICENGTEINFYDDSDTETSEGIEWFATKPEAEEFAKTLVKLKDPYIINTIYKIEEIGKFCLCKYEGMRDPDRMKGYTLSDMNGNLEFEKGNVYITTRKVSLASKDECNWLELCIKNNKFISKPPLKQVIHCKTQEEWDFVGEKIGYKFRTKFNSDNRNTINPSANSCNDRSYYEFRSNEYQILSFQEWCDLNNYTMKAKLVEFTVGKWYKKLGKNRDYYGRFLRTVNNQFFVSEYISSPTGYRKYEGSFTITDDIEECSLDEIQQFLPNNHTDKVNSSTSIEELINEAKSRYPVGTIFHSAMNPDPKYTYEVTSSEFYDWGDRGTDIVVNNSSGSGRRTR